jgi:hypothetical protein
MGSKSRLGCERVISRERHQVCVAYSIGYTHTHTPGVARVAVDEAQKIYVGNLPQDPDWYLGTTYIHKTPIGT